METKIAIEPLVWSDALSVGDPQIDWEHRQLLDIFARLCDPVYRGNMEHRRICLEELMAHVSTHFDHEETLMRQVDFPDLEHHRRVHQSLFDQFNRFATLAGEFPDEMREDDLPRFVGAWLIDHIRGDDKVLGDFLNRRARQQRIVTPPPGSSLTGP